MRVIVPLLLCIACQQEIKTGVTEPVPAAGDFETVPVSKPIPARVIDEASGIADSRVNPGYVWVIEDSGNPHSLALVSHDGTLNKRIVVNDASNIDWEDLALANGPAPNTDCLYVGDIGDNVQARTGYVIYRFNEPGKVLDELNDPDKLRFNYADGSHDAEAMLVDNATKDIYIITKRDARAGIYKIPFPQSSTALNTATKVGELSFSGVTGATISPDGKDILVRTYLSMGHYKRTAGQTVEQALSGTPVSLTVQLEPQGEAVCFKADNTGFYTLSERPSFSNGVSLHFYRRK